MSSHEGTVTVLKLDAAQKANATAAAGEMLIPTVTDASADASALAENLATGDVRSDVRWREQCVLTRLMAVFADKGQPRVSAGRAKPWHYVTSVSSQNDAGTADFLNRLHMSEGDKDFVNMTTFERNNLLWSIELSKILYKPTTKTANNSPETTEYEFDKEIPLMFEKMAAEDMESYIAQESHSHGTCDAAQLAYGGPLLDGGQLNRPQTGYGIKSFSWSLTGANPETVRNDIEAVLVLEFQNFDQLSKCRVHTDNNNTTTKYSLLDLLGYGPNSPKNELGSQDDYNPAFYEIKAHVKWNANNYQRSDEKISLKDKVKGQKTTLFLTMIDHEFSISQLGTFTLTLTYRARLESLASELRTNVVFPATSDLADVQIKDLDAQLEEAAKGCKDEKYDELIEQRALLLRRAWHLSFKNIFTNEIKSNSRDGLNNSSTPSRWSQVYALNKKKIMPTGNNFPKDAGVRRVQTLIVDRARIAKWAGGTEDLKGATAMILSEMKTSEPLSAGTLASTIVDSITKDISTDPDASTFYSRVLSSLKLTIDNQSDINTAFGVGADPYPIHFIYLGELLDIMAHRAFSDKNFSTTGTRKGSFGAGKMIKVLAGPVSLKMHGSNDGQSLKCSLSDIPISIETFSDFWYRNVIETEREVYSFMDFVRDFASQVINKALGSECAVGSFGGGISQTARVKTAFLSLPAAGNKSDPLLNIDKAGVYDTVTGDILADQMPVVNNPDLLKISKPEDIFHYIVLYLENYDAAKDLTGEEDSDAIKGIYHLKIHQGILQSIDFSKTDQPYLRESRFFIHNKNPLVHLSNVYNVNASMVGNTCFYPGDTVYINPIGFGPSLGLPMSKTSLSSVMGLGGYHTIISVSNKISKDFTTDVVAQWTSNGNAEARSSADIPTGDGCNDKKGTAVLEKNS